ncbi:MAG: flavodoxin family protein [Lachnospiraceae bacterium]|nr:flavodoxin family protein [Lachnospiraceae bacterium]
MHPCTGCVACGYEGPCVQKDDVEMIRQKLLASDMVVFATPLYYYGMSAQLKLVVDRFCAYNSSLNSRHLKSALLTVAGSHCNHMAVNVDCICLRNLSAIGENV